MGAVTRDEVVEPDVEARGDQAALGVVVPPDDRALTAGVARAGVERQVVPRSGVEERQEVARAGVEDISAVTGISRDIAQQIYDRFHE